MVEVYFDFFDRGHKIVLGVVMVEDFEVILQESKEIDKVEGQNFYHWSLDAMDYALQLLGEDDIDEVQFKNQQKLVFEWLINDSYKENYELQYGKIKKKLFRLVEEGSTFGFDVIKGDKNKAKKHLRKNNKKKELGGYTGDLTSLFVTGDKDKDKKRSTSAEVIDFLQRRRQA